MHSGPINKQIKVAYLTTQTLETIKFITIKNQTILNQKHISGTIQVETINLYIITIPISINLHPTMSMEHSSIDVLENFNIK